MKKHLDLRKRGLLIVAIVSLALFTTIFLQHEKLRPLDLAANVIFKEVGLHYYYFFNGISFLGSIYFVPVMFILALMLLWKQYKKREAVILAAATISNYIVVNAIKVFTNWARPQEVQRAIEGTFPSAHASTPLVIYFLAYIFLVKKHKKWHMLLTFLVVLLIAISRIVLNAHWLTDVIAGLLLAIVWISGVLFFCKK